jgi:hypothetical protein
MDNSISSTDKILTRQDFVNFVKDLADDFHLNKDKWENKDLQSFLAGLASYAEDLDGFYMNSGQEVKADTPSWKTFADIFMGARLYE